MGFQYLQSKGLEFRGHQKKAGSEWSMTQQQLKKVLIEVEKSAEEFNQNWKRDHGLIYLGYWLGLRIGEACILERRHFSRLFDQGTVSIPTLKNIERIPVQCPKCSKKFRVKSTRNGEMFFCNVCRSETVEIHTDRDISQMIPEKDIPIIPEHVQDYILKYIGAMRPDQRWMLETRPPRKKADGSLASAKHISNSYAAKIFYTYTMRAGLPPNFSFHSLRHGQGMIAASWSNGDLVATMKQLRHSSTQMAQRYVDLDPERKDELRKKFQKKSTFFNGSDIGKKKKGR